MRVFDAHVHIFPDRIAAPTVASMASRAGLVPTYDGTRDGLLACLRQAGIEGALNCPVATKVEQVASINEWSAAQNVWPVLSLGSIHPDCPDAMAILYGVRDAGLPGIKLHPEYQDFTLDDPRLGDVWRGCVELGLVVFMHCGGDLLYRPPFRSSPAAIRDLLDAYPGLRLVAAHFGSWKMWDEVDRELVGTDVFLDLSFVFGILPDEALVEMSRRHGVDKILFGTDAPWRDPVQELAYFLALPFTPDEQRRMLWENAARLFGFAEVAGPAREPLSQRGRGVASPGNDRDQLLALSEAQLVRLCRIDTFRGTGPGGQKRNKTESAVRITHEPSGYSAVSDATRSQHTNRSMAVRRLRLEMALKWRVPVKGGNEPLRPRPAAKADEYPLWVAFVLDGLEAHGYRLREAAESLGTGTAQLVRDLERDRQLWQWVNRARRAAGLSPLRGG